MLLGLLLCVTKTSAMNKVIAGDIVVVTGTGYGTPGINKRH